MEKLFTLVCLNIRNKDGSSLHFISFQAPKRQHLLYTGPPSKVAPLPSFHPKPTHLPPFLPLLKPPFYTTLYYIGSSAQSTSPYLVPPASPLLPLASSF